MVEYALCPNAINCELDFVYDNNGIRWAVLVQTNEINVGEPLCWDYNQGATDDPEHPQAETISHIRRVLKPTNSIKEFILQKGSQYNGAVNMKGIKGFISKNGRQSSMTRYMKNRESNVKSRLGYASSKV